MLEANKSKVFETIFAPYNRHLLKRRFHSFHVSGLQYLINKNRHSPMIIYCNHSSWWDGLIAFELSREALLESFVMMEEKQLKKLFPFRWLGAFSVVREDRRAAFESVRYAINLLKVNSERTLWIFPQGKILPNDLRPIEFYGGLGKIVEKVGKCSVASLAMRYEFLGEYKPEIFVRIETPEVISVENKMAAKNLTKNFSDRLTANLDFLRNDVIQGNFNDYQKVF